MYSVNGTTFVDYFAAVKAAKAIGSVVVLASTGEVKWSPAPAVSESRKRVYQSRLNAYKASVSK